MKGFTYSRRRRSFSSVTPTSDVKEAIDICAPYVSNTKNESFIRKLPNNCPFTRRLAKVSRGVKYINIKVT